MKKTITLLLSVLAAVSCNFLDETLKGGYTAENYYTSESKAELAVNAIYNSLYDNVLWIFGDVASDDSVKGGDDGDQPQINEIDQFIATSDNGSLDQFWKSTYETIARANNAIDGISGMEINETTKARLIGEAKFLRAYSYFNLVNIFGQVPLKTRTQNTSAAIHVGLSRRRHLCPDRPRPDRGRRRTSQGQRRTGRTRRRLRTAGQEQGFPGQVRRGPRGHHFAGEQQ